MKQVFAAKTAADAHLVKGLLEARGIPAEVHSEALSGLLGEVPLAPGTQPSVWVLDDLQVPEGVQIVDEYLSSASAAGPQTESWECSGCGERLEPQFSECWKCGGSSPGHRLEDSRDNIDE